MSATQSGDLDVDVHQIMYVHFFVLQMVEGSVRCLCEGLCDVCERWCKVCESSPVLKYLIVLRFSSRFIGSDI